jgi:hypothetical protein
MIRLALQSMWRRIPVLIGVAFVFYLLEPGFHNHELPAGTGLNDLTNPAGLTFTLSNLAALCMVVLLAGFISGDRRHGYYRLLLSQPVDPLAMYAVRWVLAYGISMVMTAAFMVLGQLAAWSGLRVGAESLVQPFIFAAIYGAIVAFLSALLPRWDAPLAVALYFASDIWAWLVRDLGAEPFTPFIRQVITFALPPHGALEAIYEGMLSGAVAWSAVAYACGYALFFLLVSAALLRLREWP